MEYTIITETSFKVDAPSADAEFNEMKMKVVTITAELETKGKYKYMRWLVIFFTVQQWFSNHG